jgi:uncharacterized protein (TIGR03083 family)
VDNSPYAALDFDALLRLVDERGAAFRAAVAAAPDLDATVPTCPEWSVYDLAEHIGVRRPFWAAVVAAGPADAPPEPPVLAAAPKDREALVAWLAQSTRQLVDALREAGPDRGCWTWWGDSQSPRTTGAVARHQLQEIAVHTYDAQLAAGVPASLPDAVAADGIDEFLHTCVATTSPWPHEPARVDFLAEDGRSWRLDLSASGARVVRRPAADVTPDASARATAAQLVLMLHGRVPLDSLRLEGRARIFEQMAEWEPEV